MITHSGMLPYATVPQGCCLIKSSASQANRPKHMRTAAHWLVVPIIQKNIGSLKSNSAIALLHLGLSSIGPDHVQFRSLLTTFSKTPLCTCFTISSPRRLRLNLTTGAKEHVYCVLYLEVCRSSSGRVGRGGGEEVGKAGGGRNSKWLGGPEEKTGILQPGLKRTRLSYNIRRRSRKPRPRMLRSPKVRDSYTAT